MPLELRNVLGLPAPDREPVAASSALLPQLLSPVESLPDQLDDSDTEVPVLVPPLLHPLSLLSLSSLLLLLPDSSELAKLDGELLPWLDALAWAGTADSFEGFVVTCVGI